MTAPCCVAGVVSRNIQRKPSSLQTSPGLQGHEGAAGGQVRVQTVRLLLFRFPKTKIMIMGTCMCAVLRNMVQNRNALDILYYCQKCPLTPSLISHHSPQSVRLVFVEQRLLPSFSGIIARVALLSVATANC